MESKVILGDATFKHTILDDSVQAIITSPPYFNLRKYSEDKGHEAVENWKGGNGRRVCKPSVKAFHNFKDCLKDDGLLWLNLGDTFINKEMQGVPWRTALALANDGWILRTDVIWHKPNAMPYFVTSRPTIDHEYVFMFSKNKDYYYDADAIREPHVTFSENSKMRGEEPLRRVKMPETPICIKGAGIRPSIPRGGTRGPFGAFPLVSLEVPTLPYFRKRWSRYPFWHPRARGIWSWIPLPVLALPGS